MNRELRNKANKNKNKKKNHSNKVLNNGENHSTTNIDSNSIMQKIGTLNTKKSKQQSKITHSRSLF